MIRDAGGPLGSMVDWINTLARETGHHEIDSCEGWAVRHHMESVFWRALEHRTAAMAAEIERLRQRLQEYDDEA